MYNHLSKIMPTVGKGTNPLHVVVLYGGLSPEREVSIMSGNVVCDQIKDMDYKVTPIDMGIDIAEVLHEVKPDVVFNALHGTYGEDGCIQGLLEILKIPYTHSGVLASAIALDKVYSQQILVANGITCPKRVIVSKGDDLSVEPIERPYVIKPLNQGSSLGVDVVFLEDNYDLSKYKFEFGNQAIIEEYIAGHEIQVAVLNGKSVGSLEIVCLQGKRFNDYDCKYKDGYSRHDCPPNILESANKRMLEVAEQIHNFLGCKGVTRVEFRYNPEKDKAYFLEINTHPGLTLLSSAPDIIQKNGINFQEFIRILIDEAINSNENKK
ncbi:MAG: D-alanine--D-alanine ligase [Pseudomonadota bacterium]